MGAFDRVVGYEDVKNEMLMYCDILKNPEKYTALGIKSPQGILLHGRPGIGKTLMATCFAEESQRNVFVLRKNKPDGEFVHEINDTFRLACEKAPSIILLDDLDKFAEKKDEFSDAEEFVTVQTCIDSIKDRDVFVIATTNELYELPQSLRRMGRFDKIYELEEPSIRDSEDILAYYLNSKKLSGDIDFNEIARYMAGRSCVELETVINEAGIYAGYRGASAIEQEDLVKASLRSVIGGSPISHDEDNETLKYRAVHEAGHAVAAEVLEPGSVNVITIRGTGGAYGGMTCFRKKDEYYDYESKRKEIIRKLGGKAAIEVVLGLSDMGSKEDVDDAFNELNKYIGQGLMGFDAKFFDFFFSWWEINRERKISGELDACYQEAKRIIIKNREFIDVLVNQLMDRRILTYKDIERIKATLSDGR